jgi:chorismate synthase
VVGEAMVAIVLADAALEKFGSDSIEEVVANWRAYRERTASRFAAR